MLTFNDYQEGATGTADYPMLGDNIIYPALGCAEEAGEIAGKVKKLWRNKGKMAGRELTPDEKSAVVKEMGDNLWYLAALASELDISLGEVAVINLDKLADRKARGVIKSEGDNR